MTVKREWLITPLPQRRANKGLLFKRRLLFVEESAVNYCLFQRFYRAKLIICMKTSYLAQVVSHNLLNAGIFKHNFAEIAVNLQNPAVAECFMIHAHTYITVDIFIVRIIILCIVIIALIARFCGIISLFRMINENN